MNSRLPTGRAPGHSCRAAVRLTMATGVEPVRSPGENGRPASSGTPRVRKYPGLAR